jgi:hypothetical protein
MTILIDSTTLRKFRNLRIFCNFLDWFNKEIISIKNKPHEKERKKENRQ